VYGLLGTMSITSPRREITEILRTVQRTVFQGRVRIRELFVDYDKLRSGRCTGAQFRRALDLSKVFLPDEEVEILENRYRSDTFIRYDDFCDDVDSVFSVKYLEVTPRRHVDIPGTPLKRSSRSAAAVHNPPLHAVLHRLALFCQSRGVVVKYCYQDFDRSHSGCVTEPQFLRQFPFHKLVSQVDIERVLDHYRESDEKINYRALHDDVMEYGVGNIMKQPFPTSNWSPSKDTAEWTSWDYSVEQRLMAQVVAKRIRLREYFQDFDPLRKGYCTVGQLRTVRNITGLHMSEEDTDHIIHTYSREDGCICYEALLAVIEAAFTNTSLEVNPTAKTEMPNVWTTFAARRSYQKLAAHEEQAIGQIEARIRDRVSSRRVPLLSLFQDFDRAHEQGTKKAVQEQHCSKLQFSRVMFTQGFELTNAEVELLAKRYCDKGNNYWFNYHDFCESCDPQWDIAIARQQSDLLAMNRPATCSKYFTRRGQVVPLTPGRGPMTPGRVH